MNKTIHTIGFWSGLAAFCATITYCVIQIMQLFGLIKYPTDEILIYGSSLCIVIPFLIEILALHYLTDTNKKFWSHAALIFTTLYAVFVTANYVVQLATVIPSPYIGITIFGQCDRMETSDSDGIHPYFFVLLFLYRNFL